MKGEEEGTEEGAKEEEEKKRKRKGRKKIWEIRSVRKDNFQNYYPESSKVFKKK